MSCVMRKRLIYAFMEDRGDDGERAKAVQYEDERRTIIEVASSKYNAGTSSTDSNERSTTAPLARNGKGLSLGGIITQLPGELDNVGDRV